MAPSLGPRPVAGPGPSAGHTRMEAAIVWLSTLSFWNKNLIENFYFVCKVMLTCNSASPRAALALGLL